VRFHDGSPVEPGDVVASVDRIRSHPRYDPAGVYRAVVEVAAGGSRDVVFRLREPSPAFPSLVAYYSSPVLKPGSFGADGRLEGLVATGPYRLIEVRRGEAVVTGRFEGYWGPPAVYDRVTFRTIPDARTRIAALLSGEVDAVADVGAILPTQVAALRLAPEVHVGEREVATTHYLFFNCSRAPFAARGARRWLAAAIDRPALVRSVVGSGGVVAADPFSRLARGWASGAFADPAVTAPPPAPSSAVRIVVSAATVERWPYLEIVQHVEDRLRRSGWRAKIAVLEPGAYQQALRRRDFDLVVQPNTLMTGDPDFFYSYYLHSLAPSCFGCGGTETDRLIEEARHERSVERRRGLYRRLAGTVATNVPVVPLYHDVSAYAYRSGVEGFAIDAHFRPVLTRRPPAAR
jgi:peptide/nickel transport system substrate-binding protein